MALEKGYKMQRCLGSGHFGDVYLANKRGRSFAIKKVVNTEQDIAKQEIKILKQVDHGFIIKYYDHFMENRILCIVLEYADKGTMEKAVKTHCNREKKCIGVLERLCDNTGPFHLCKNGFITSEIHLNSCIYENRHH